MKSESVVLSKVLKIEQPIFGRTNTRVIAGTPPKTTIMQSRKLYRDEYQCAKGSLLTRKIDHAGINGQWYYLDETLGKSVILDDKLIELLDLLESLGLRPFFNGNMDSTNLCVRL